MLEDDALEEPGWQLLAFEILTKTGFASPLYAQRDNTNTYSAAVCVPDGDPQGLIADFEPVDASGAETLPGEKIVLAHIGGPWRDVFLWSDEAFVGTPSELWTQLSSQWREIRRLAPLAAVDLALNAGRLELEDVATGAFDYLVQRWGRETASTWRSARLRVCLQVFLGRALRKAHAPLATQALVTEVSLGVEASDQILFDLPPDLVAALGPEVAVPLSELRRLGHVFRVEIAFDAYTELAAAGRVAGLAQPDPPAMPRAAIAARLIIKGIVPSTLGERWRTPTGRQAQPSL